jgi:hypothetical protein
MSYRRAAPREPARDQCLRYGGDVFVQAALGDDHRDQQGFNASTEQTATAEPLDHEPRRTTDQQHHSYDAADAARDLAASLAVQFAVEESNRAAREHNRMGDMAKDRRHVAEQCVDRQAGDEQEQSIGIGRGYHALRGRRRSASGEQ